MTMIAHDVDRFDDIGVLEGGADAEFGSNLFVVLLFCFARAAWTELFDGIDDTAVLGLALYEADGASGSRAQGSTEFAILFGDGCMGGICKGGKGTVGGGVGVGVADKGGEGGMGVVGGGFGRLGL